MRIESVGMVLSMFLAAALGTGCVAPIASRSSPAHTTHIEIENATPDEYDIEISLTEGALGEVGYRGRLRPGEVESLYLSNGEDYRFQLKDPATGDNVATREYEVWAYTNLIYDGEEFVLGDATVEVSPSARVAFEPRRSLIPLYAGVMSTGFAPTAASVKGQAQLETSASVSPVVGFSGETRFLSDYFAVSGNFGYAPSEFFHSGFISFGPMVKFRPYEKVGPYVFATAGIAALLPKDMILQSGEEVNPEFMLNMAYDGGGGLLIGVSPTFTIDTQFRIHRIRLDPIVHEDSGDFDNENLFTDANAMFPEFRVGIRYAMGD